MHADQSHVNVSFNLTSQVERFEKAVEEIQEQICKADVDGQIQGAWLLTE